jgi:hypothetical protein
MTITLKDAGRNRKLNRNDVRLLWYADFWDGPINGLCIYQNKKHWFEMSADDAFPDTNQRRFVVLDLSPEQLADEEQWHELFRQKVGTHCDFEEPHPEIKPIEFHREFYDTYQQRATRDFSANVVIGWFEMT